MSYCVFGFGLKTGRGTDGLGFDGCTGLGASVVEEAAGTCGVDSTGFSGATDTGRGYFRLIGLIRFSFCIVKLLGCICSISACHAFHSSGSAF